MKKTTIVLCLFLSFSLTHAQRRISFGIELGVNTSDLPYSQTKHIEKSSSASIAIYRSVISPKVGFWSKLELGQNLYSNLGFHYFKTGYNNYENTIGYSKLYNTTYTSDEWKSLNIHKLSIPISLGYQAHVANTRVYFGIGYKKQVHLAGFYKSSYMYQDQNPDKNFEQNEYYNFFDKNNKFYQIRRWNAGVFLECGFIFNDKIGIDLSYGINHELYFSGSQYLDYMSVYNIDNKDISISIKYALNKHSK
jgi:hypothetical protein